MLIGLLNLIFNILFWALRVAGWLMLIYCLLTWVIPNNKYTQLLGKYMEPMLNPIRKLLNRLIPALGRLPLDFSPIAFWLLLRVASWLLSLLRSILL